MKWSPRSAALLIALPLSSFIALSLQWLDTKDTVSVAKLSMDIFKLVVPSLAFFPTLSLLLIKTEISYWPALILSSLLAVLCYTVQNYFGWGI